MADGLADLTMDRRQSWSKKYITKLDPQHSNLVIQTDGGLREGDCAAAAWIAGLWGRLDGAPLFEPLMVQGTFLESNVSVFSAEAIALDEATTAVDNLIQQWHLSV